MPKQKANNTDQVECEYFHDCFELRDPTFVLRHSPVIHPLIPIRSHEYFPFSKTMIAVVTHANVCSQRGETNRPIFRRSLVNKTRGITAKESCRLRMT